MGCGISTLDAEDPSLARRRSKGVRQHAIVPPVPENKKYYDNDVDDGVADHHEEAKTKEEGMNGERLKERSVVERKEEHVVSDDLKNPKDVKNDEEEENNEDRDIHSFIGPGSPSFRDYCNDYDSVDRSSVGDPNDYCDSAGESTKNGSDDDSTNRLRNDRCVNCNKVPEKKERRGRGFRNVINKGKTRGRRNLLNFACYNSSNQSYAEGSINKIVGKTA